MPFPITVFSKNPQRETDFEPNVSYLLDPTVIKCSNSSIIKMVKGKGFRVPRRRNDWPQKSAFRAQWVSGKTLSCIESRES